MLSLRCRVCVHVLIQTLYEDQFGEVPCDIVAISVHTCQIYFLSVLCYKLKVWIFASNQDKACLIYEKLNSWVTWKFRYLLICLFLSEILLPILTVNSKIILKISCQFWRFVMLLTSHERKFYSLFFVLYIVQFQIS